MRASQQQACRAQRGPRRLERREPEQQYQEHQRPGRRSRDVPCPDVHRDRRRGRSVVQETRPAAWLRAAWRRREEQPRAAQAEPARPDVAAQWRQAAGSGLSEPRPAAAPCDAALQGIRRRAARAAPAAQRAAGRPEAARAAPAVRHGVRGAQARQPAARPGEPAARRGPAVRHAAPRRAAGRREAERRRGQHRPGHRDAAAPRRADPWAAVSEPAYRRDRARQQEPARKPAARFARATAWLRIGPASGRWWQAARREV
ncbi:hypothetical protein HNR60_000157 [Rhodopseudomonas rhenobacensis]|uniref:Uncharacterized protein n=1 Tax=Rhodopseudomonas rhenobacensis TaxID=87461 RepID=A0A7W7YZW8_9BRAD|nr:hypothetical protein [Rhodopseudomonas rhenobacensis]